MRISDWSSDVCSSDLKCLNTTSLPQRQRQRPSSKLAFLESQTDRVVIQLRGRSRRKRRPWCDFRAAGAHVGVGDRNRGWRSKCASRASWAADFLYLSSSTARGSSNARSYAKGEGYDDG